LRCKEEIAKGISTPNFISKYLEQVPDISPEGEDRLMWTAASIYGAAYDTTMAFMITFFLAMAMSPDSQARAQKEIDQLLGSKDGSGLTRLPLYSDREKLPFVEAIVLELVRWGCVGPLGLPHSVEKDDVYQGMRIPKKTLVLVNMEEILRDPQNYEDPTAFKPERFMGDWEARGILDPRSVTFGYGRRVCPGKAFAHQSLWILAASILATFNISAIEGETLKYELADGVVTVPKPFGCNITPRSKQTEQLVRSAVEP